MKIIIIIIFLFCPCINFEKIIKPINHLTRGVHISSRGPAPFLRQEWAIANAVLESTHEDNAVAVSYPMRLYVLPLCRSILSVSIGKRAPTPLRDG